jgi:hypothetical protein
MKPSARSLLLWALALLALGAIFTAYLNPHLAVVLATSVWSCF